MLKLISVRKIYVHGERMIFYISYVHCVATKTKLMKSKKQLNGINACENLLNFGNCSNFFNWRRPTSFANKRNGNREKDKRVRRERSSKEKESEKKK